MRNHGFEYFNVFRDYVACSTDRRQDCQADETPECDRISGNRIADWSNCLKILSEELIDSMDLVTELALGCIAFRLVRSLKQPF